MICLAVKPETPLTYQSHGIQLWAVVPHDGEDDIDDVFISPDRAKQYIDDWLGACGQMPGTLEAVTPDRSELADELKGQYRYKDESGSVIYYLRPVRFRY